MHDIPAISVVIPLYNKESYIAGALNSIFSQTSQDFEVIVVDDGSTDGGTEIVKECQDPRIRLIQQENKGVSAARNRGIEAARSELIAFLDADDEWLPLFIETILRLRSLYPNAGLYGTAYEVHYPGSIVQKVYNKSEGERLLSSFFGALVEFGSAIFNSSSSAAPKDVLIGVGGYPLGVKWNEDGTLWGKIALQYPIAYSPEICSIYRQYTESNSIGITEYLENPFVQYLSTIPKNELSKISYFRDLMEYSELCRLEAISRNIFSGHGARARSELQLVKSPCLSRKKYELRVFSYVPPMIMDLIRKNASALSYIKRKIIRD
jgi:glycosyltransferase involved in cell wall biosynthesis